MTLTIFLLALGATARLTRLVTDDYVTRHLRAAVIRRFGPDHDLAYLVTCPWCISMYIGGVIMTIAWFVGEHAGFTIPAAALTASYLIGVAASILEPAEEDD